MDKDKAHVSVVSRRCSFHDLDYGFQINEMLLYPPLPNVVRYHLILSDVVKKYAKLIEHHQVMWSGRCELDSTRLR